MPTSAATVTSPQPWQRPRQTRMREGASGDSAGSAGSAGYDPRRTRNPHWFSWRHLPLETSTHLRRRSVPSVVQGPVPMILAVSDAPRKLPGHDGRYQIMKSRVAGGVPCTQRPEDRKQRSLSRLDSLAGCFTINRAGGCVVSSLHVGTVASRRYVDTARLVRLVRYVRGSREADHLIDVYQAHVSRE